MVGEQTAAHYDGSGPAYLPVCSHGMFDDRDQLLERLFRRTPEVSSCLYKTKTTTEAAGCMLID